MEKVPTATRVFEGCQAASTRGPFTGPSKLPTPKAASISAAGSCEAVANRSRHYGTKFAQLSVPQPDSQSCHARKMCCCKGQAFDISAFAWSDAYHRIRLKIHSNKAGIFQTPLTVRSNDVTQKARDALTGTAPAGKACGSTRARRRDDPKRASRPAIVQERPAGPLKIDEDYQRRD
jgi:hypothetical protein